MPKWPKKQLCLHKKLSIPNAISQPTKQICPLAFPLQFGPSLRVGISSQLPQNEANLPMEMQENVGENTRENTPFALSRHPPFPFPHFPLSFYSVGQIGQMSGGMNGKMHCFQ
jgi:hypothetical protein